MSSRTTKASSSGRVGPSRFTRSAPASSSRPPIVLEWGSAFVRVGYTEQFHPQWVFRCNCTKPMSKRQWYSFLEPLVSKIWDQLLLTPNSARRVVCAHPPFMPNAWTWAVTKAFANQGVPGVCFVTGIDLIPYAMGWKRGIVLDVGRIEARVQAHVDGMALHDTLQVVPCGYEAVMADRDSAQINWDDDIMQWHWLDERNPCSLMAAFLKSLEAAPRDARKDVVANIVLMGGTVMGVPDLSRRFGQKLKSLLKRASPEPSPEQEKVEEQELTMTPTQWKKLASLESHVSVLSTEPHRADSVSWVASSVWATVCHPREGQWISPHDK